MNEISTKKDYMKSATDFIQECEFSILDSTKHSNQQVHQSIVKPYIKTENIKSLFNDTVTSTCSAISIFDPKKVKDDTQYGMNEVAKLASFHSSLTLSDLQDEWKTFRNYMKVQSTKQECPTAKVVGFPRRRSGRHFSLSFQSFQDYSCLSSWYHG